MKDTEWLREVELPTEPLLTECATEYTLPDYLPDMRRVVEVRGKLMPNSQYLEGNRGECTGACVCSVLYCDPNGHINAFSLPLEYHYTPSVTAMDKEQIKWYEDQRLDHLTYRLMGPRKIQLKATVVSRSTFWEAEEKEALKDEEGMEIFTQPCTARRVYPFRGEEKRMTFTLPLSAGKDIQILLTNGEVFVREWAEEKSGDLAKGEVKLEAVCVGEDGIPFTVFGKAAFEEVLPEEAYKILLCQGKLTALEANVNETEAGAEIAFDFGVALSGFGAENETHQVVADAFSTLYPMTVSYEEETMEQQSASATRFFTLDGSIDREENTPLQVMTVASTSIVAAPLSFSLEGNRLTVSTNAHVHMLLSDSGGEDTPTLETKSFLYPLKMEIAFTEAPPEDSRWEGVCTLSPAHGRADQSKLYFEVDCSLTVWGVTKKTVRSVKDVTCHSDEPYEKSKHTVIAAYLKDGDTLWQLAKRYHTSPAQIAKQNGLPEEALENPDEAYTLDGYIRLLITS